jgi:integral membrane protein (TIGR01906 family)
MVNNYITGIVRWLVILAMPILLLLTFARGLISEGYLRYEYGKADFPPDIYGFTQAERLELASVAIRFLWQEQPAEQAVAMLEAQRLPGSNQPLYNPYELSHMIDVKHFTEKLWRVYWGSVVLVLGGLGWLLARRETRPEAFNALLGGGLLTSGLLIGLTSFVLLSWRTFFIQFHELFFEPGTWTFNWSDSLIRLFPDRFWFDAGAIITVSTLVAGIIVAAVGYLLRRRARV